MRCLEANRLPSSRGEGEALDDCANTSDGLVPISDLSRGLPLGQYPGGLYPNGQDSPPGPPHSLAGQQAASIATGFAVKNRCSKV
ncbi:MAG: hypothetical protein JNL80_04190 [Phycisphaerae bacterium]|nr:hypothetical protein [Phycisphaerae bacterium]